MYLSSLFYKLPNSFNRNFWDAVHKRCRHVHPRNGGIIKVGREVPRYLQWYTRQNILTTATCNRILAKVRKLGVCLPFFFHTFPFPHPPLCWSGATPVLLWHALGAISMTRRATHLNALLTWPVFLGWRGM